MDASARLSFGKIITAVIILVISVSLLTLLAFILGQRSGIEIASKDQTSSHNSKTTATDDQEPAAMPALPKAMTATPASKQLEKWTITDDQATQLALEQNNTSDSELPVLINQIEFAPSEIRITGEINYAGYAGNLDVLGYPVIEARQLNFRVTDLFLNDQVLPQLAYPVVEMQVNDFFSHLLAGYDVINVNTEKGVISADLLPW